MRMSYLRAVSVAAWTTTMIALGPFSMAAFASGPERLGAAQDRADQRPDEHRHFADHDRQVVQGWYDQHRGTPPPGLRDSDRLDATLSARITIGAVLDSDLRTHVHTVPADLLQAAAASATRRSLLLR